MRRSLGLSLIAFSFSLISACGGGGGGGGSSNSSADNNPASPASITRANAKQIVQASLTPAIFSDNALDNILYDFGYFRSIASGAGNSLTVSENQTCSGGGSYQLSGTISAVGDSGDVTITYSNCVVNYYGYGSYTYDGSIQGKLQAVDGLGNAVKFEYIYRNYRTEYRDQNNVASSGVTDGNVSMVSANKITASFTIKDLQSGDSISTNDFESIYTTTQYPYNANRSGHVTHSKLGIVSLSSDGATPNTSFITGANQARIRAIESLYSFGYFDLSLDENGDGNYDSFTSGYVDSFDATYSSNTAPTVNVDYSMLHPSIDDSASIPLNGIYDNEDDFLNYSARVLQSPNNVNIGLTLTENKTLVFHTHGAGDYVIELTVNDGNGGVTAQNISIHVWLPTPQVTPTYSSSINTGDNVVINLQPSNNEAGPFAYRLASGPAGMTVDSNGIVRWQAGSSFFFPQMDVQAVVEVSNADHIISIPLKLSLQDTNKAHPIARTNTGGSTHTKNTFVLDFNHDGTKEILTTDNGSLLHTMKYGNGTYKQDWIYPYAIGKSQISFIYPFDRNGTGDYEIAVQTRDIVSIIDKTHSRTDRSTVVSLSTSSYDTTYAYGLSVADIDGDGALEIVTLIGNGFNSAQIVVLDATSLTEKWRTGALSLSNDFSIGNVDNDSALEIVTSNGYVFDGQTHINEWLSPTQFGSSISVGDIDGDGIDEIVGITSNSIQAFSAITKSLLWQTTPPSSIFTALSLAQLDIDSGKEILAVNSGNNTVVAYDATNANITSKWSTSYTAGYSSPDVLAGDSNNDNLAEVVLSGSDRIEVLNATTHAVDFSNKNTSYLGYAKSFVGGAVGAFGGSNLGIFNATIAGYTGSNQQIVGVALDQGTIQYGPTIYSFSTANLCLADYDNDGILEVFASASSNNNYNEYVVNFDFLASTKEWARTAANYSYGSNLITCGDFNNDGHIDVAGIFDGNHLEIDDAFQQTQIWVDSAASPAIQIGNADLDGDGKPELITQDQNYVKAFKFNGANYHQYRSYNIPTALGNYYSETVLSVQDIDGDGHTEIIAGAREYYSSESTILIILNSDLTERMRVNVEGLVVAIAPEPMSNGQIIAAIRYTEPDTTSYYSLDRSRVAAIDLNTGNWVWRSPTLLSQVNANSLHVHNAGTANPRLVIGTQAAAIITR